MNTEHQIQKRKTLMFGQMIRKVELCLKEYH